MIDQIIFLSFVNCVMVWLCWMLYKELQIARTTYAEIELRSAKWESFVEEHGFRIYQLLILSKGKASFEYTIVPDAMRGLDPVKFLNELRKEQRYHEARMIANVEGDTLCSLYQQCYRASFRND